MSHLYVTSEWQGASGRWYVNDVTDFTSVACKWWAPVRLLNMTPIEYVLMLKNDFNASDFRYTKEKNVLIFSFATQTDARKYKNFINKKAREKQFIL